MAARNYLKNIATLHRDVVKLWAKCIGAAGATPTGQKSLGSPAAAFAWVSTGKYTLTLSDKYAALLAADFRVIDSTGLRHYSFSITSETVASTKIITFEVYAAASTVAPTRADLAATDTLLVELTLSNTAQAPTGY